MFEYNKQNKHNARTMRKSMTPWEQKLWFDCLCDFPIKFYKQRPIGNYIVDFYCAKNKVAIELDGSQHYTEEEIEYDKARTKFLNSQGIKVLRYTNAEIDTQFEDVCADIYNNVMNK